MSTWSRPVHARFTCVSVAIGHQGCHPLATPTSALQLPTLTWGLIPPPSSPLFCSALSLPFTLCPFRTPCFCPVPKLLCPSTCTCSVPPYDTPCVPFLIDWSPFRLSPHCGLLLTPTPSFLAGMVPYARGSPSLGPLRSCGPSLASGDAPSSELLCLMYFLQGYASYRRLYRHTLLPPIPHMPRCRCALFYVHGALSFPSPCALFSLRPLPFSIAPTSS